MTVIGNTPVQQAVGSTSAGSASFTVTQAAFPTNGNCLIANIPNGSATNPTVSVSQDGTPGDCVWQRSFETHAGLRCEVWKGNIVGAGAGKVTTITMTDLGAVTTVRANVCEESGMTKSFTPNASAGGSGTSTNPTATCTPTAGKDAKAYFVARDIDTAFTSIDNGFTQLTNTSNFYLSGYKKFAATAGAIIGQATYTVSALWEAAIVVFLADNPTTNISVQPPATIASGGALTGFHVKNTFDTVETNTAFTGNAVVTIASGAGGALANATVPCVAGEADLSGVTLTGSGAYTLQVACAGFTAVISAAVTVSVPALVMTAQPATSVASGGTLTATVTLTTNGVTTDPVTKSVTATLNGPNGSVTAGGTVNSVTGVATFPGIVPTADGPGFTLTFACAGYTSVTSTLFTVIGSKVAALQALVAGCGGNAAMPDVYDFGIYAGQTLATLPDSIGPVGGRSAGVVLVQATGAKQPTVSAGGIAQFVAANQTSMASVATARLNFDGSVGTPNPLFVWALYKATGVGPVACIAKDHTSAVTYPYVAIQPAGANHKANVATDGTAPTGFTSGSCVPDMGIAFNDGTYRWMIIGKNSFVNSSNVDGRYTALMDGRQPREHVRLKTATPGACHLAVGQLGSTFWDGELVAFGTLAVDPIASVIDAFRVFAATKNATRDTTITKNGYICTGSSLVVGTTNQPGGDTMTPVAGTGTTSWPFVAQARNSGLGTFAAQGFDVTDVHAYNRGWSGGNIQQMIDQYPTHVRLTGKLLNRRVVTFALEMGNSIQGLAWNTATLLAKMQEYRDLHIADGHLLVWLTGVDRGGSSSPAGWYADTNYLATSSQGDTQIAGNAALVAAPASYGYATIDVEGSATQHFKVVPLGNVNTHCLSTTYYNFLTISDNIHLSPTGYAEVGGNVRDWIDGNISVFIPSTGGGSAFAAATVKRHKKRFGMMRG